MKDFIVKLLLFIIILLPNSTFGKDNDSLIFKNEHYTVLQNTTNKKYSIHDAEQHEKFTQLKHVTLLYPNLQVITAKNELLYLDTDLKKVAVLDDPFYGVCGTVPHYALTIEKSANGFDILEDETFYDQNNEPPVIKKSIPFSKADQVTFINQLTSYLFTANYGYGDYWIPDPRTVIYQQGKYTYILDDPENMAYDKVSLKDGKLMVEKDGLIGIYGYTAVMFKSIEAYSYDIATVTMPNGKKGFVNLKGTLFIQ
ncbi:hypothetical protein DNU06_12065 [Putridiphycobacter roseus]|uniref:WG repeat-containing protein n=1 Tax=Putridiphycobacter roseus TaxID=2219161 RepID=A0A2W1NLN9_9FLAO|nr:hypothetical protein [Putridiphycobacter roseus]PZE16582.1 hypothetical protein DNU06_12065 [Putridiphycobacter roseus]